MCLIAQYDPSRKPYKHCRKYEFSMGFVETRIENFRKVLSSKKLDAIVLANFDDYGPQGGDYNLYYISNILKRFPYCFLVMTEDECKAWIEG